MSILAGKRILVTRALDQNAQFIAKLEAKQAIALVYPCLEIIFLPFEIPNEKFNWVIYTSKNAVKALQKYSLAIKIAHIDPKTAPNSKSLAKLFENLTPQKILLPQGDLADDFLKNKITQQGHQVTRLIVYRTCKPIQPVDFNFGKLDAITFTSPSAIRNFLDLGGLASGVIACIGTTTYQAARDLGFKNVICAKEHSLDGLVQILEEHFS